MMVEERTNRAWRRRPALAVAAAAALGAAILAPTHAQTQGGAIAGQVVDRDGDPLPGVVVVATNPGATEAEWLGPVTTDRQGRYRIANPEAGTYSVTFWLPGFGRAARNDLEVRASSTQVVDFELAPGADANVPITIGPPRVTIGMGLRPRPRMCVSALRRHPGLPPRSRCTPGLPLALSAALTGARASEIPSGRVSLPQDFPESGAGGLPPTRPPGRAATARSRRRARNATEVATVVGLPLADLPLVLRLEQVGGVQVEGPRRPVVAAAELGVAPVADGEVAQPAVDGEVDEGGGGENAVGDEVEAEVIESRR